MPPRTKKNQEVKSVESVPAHVPVSEPVPHVPEPVVQVESTPTAESAKKKRGRKKPETTATTETSVPNIPTITAAAEEPAETTNVAKKQKNKKTKSKKETTEINEVVASEPDTTTTTITTTSTTTTTVTESDGIASTNVSVVATNKKRGRKPKGGKVIQLLTNDNATINVVPNIILHLKCSASDIPNNDLASNDNFKPGDVVSFNAMENKGSDLNDSYQSQMNSIIMQEDSKKNDIGTTNAYNYLNDNESEDDDDGNNSTKDILKKLNHLKTSFHRSDVFQAIGAAPRRSCCFWDTCEFDTPPIYLPKSISNNGGYVVYACFCSPECALAYLMNERIDTSVKFERCQMLNAMHGKINVSIKPAPNPQYILSKFYGNLSIQEYRKLFKSEQIVYVVNKPLTHILPEIYEENNDFMLNNKIIPTNNYKPKKKASVFG